MQPPHPPGYVSDQHTYTQQPGIYPSLDVVSPHQPVSLAGGDVPITVQPGLMAPPSLMMVPLPPPIEGVPPGLEYLTMVDHIYIQQVTQSHCGKNYETLQIYEILELFASWECRNKYSLKNANGQQVKI